jgi:hypothetical protein
MVGKLDHSGKSGQKWENWINVGKLDHSWKIRPQKIFVGSDLSAMEKNRLQSTADFNESFVRCLLGCRYTVLFQ